MKKEITLLLFTYFGITKMSTAQTINQYLNGIWKMECCDPDYWVIKKNCIYWINDKNVKTIKQPILKYCIPKVATFNKGKDSGQRIYKNTISLDSVDFDRDFVLDEMGMEQVYLLEFKDEDIINGKEIKINDTGISLDFYHINPKESNRYYVWDNTSPSKIVYYNRILSPPKYILDFYKKIAKETFKTVNKSKAYIFSNKLVKTKMYLIKGDEVEIIEEKGDWIKIRYYGKKTIEGWIKKSDVE